MYEIHCHVGLRFPKQLFVLLAGSLTAKRSSVSFKVIYLAVFEVWDFRTGVEKKIFWDMKPYGLVNITDVYKDLCGSSRPYFFM
jgi:hypothetical protein